MMRIISIIMGEWACRDSNSSQWLPKPQGCQATPQAPHCSRRLYSSNTLLYHIFLFLSDDIDPQSFFLIFPLLNGLIRYTFFAEAI